MQKGLNANWFFLVVSFISINCAMTQEQFEQSHWDAKTKGPIPTFTETKIEILEIKMLPDSGTYYIYKPSALTDKITNINNKLRRLYVIGFDVTMAWYRPPLGGCNKPGTTGITATIYPEFLLIRLSEPNKLLENYNFRQIEQIKSLPCPYKISYYLPKFPNSSKHFDNL